MTTRLSELGPGQRARVVGLADDGALGHRLLELGLVPGIEVGMVRSAPLGDPLEYEFMGYHLSLRRAEAAAILVEAIP